MAKIITIKESTKERLDGAKVHPRETYDDVVSRLLSAQCEIKLPVEQKVEPQIEGQNVEYPR